MTSLSEGGSPQQEARVRMALHEVLEAGDWDAADHADFIINVAAGLVARGLLLSSPRAPESTPTEGDPCRMLREMEAAIAACLNETDERPDYPRLYAVREKVRAYLSSREQPQDGT